MKKLMTAAMVAAGLTGAAAGLGVTDAKAGAEPFLGEIMMVGYNFCPRGWANADGQLLSISQYTALFSLYGTYYGGDGRATFALPDLRGRFAMHAGQGGGLPPRREGERGGHDSVSLNQQQLAPHTHVAAVTTTATSTAKAAPGPASLPNPGGNVLALTTGGSTYAAAAGTLVAMAPEATELNVDVAVTNANTGNGAPVDVTNPYLVIRYCIALQGIFPSRN